MADPLKLLREYALDGRTIREKDHLIIFGDVAFERDVRTNFKVYGKANEYYTLESLHFFYQKREMAHTAYVKEAAGQSIQPVTRPDRKDLIDHLTKHNAKQPASIDLTAPIPVPVQLSKADLDQPPDAKRARIDEAELQKDKERFRMLVDQPIARPDELRDLSKDLTVDKLRALRQKAMMHRRNQIKSTEDQEYGTAAAEGPSAAEKEALDRDLKLRERVWRTRMSCLTAGAKNFQKSVFPVLQSLKSREDARKEVGKPEPVVNEPVKARPAPQTGYSRYDQEQFSRKGTEDFQIDIRGSYHGITLRSITEGAKPKSGAAQPQNSAKAAEQPRPHKRASRTPIIVIPASNTSLVTMYNVRELLQDLKYISTEDMRAAGKPRDNEVLIQRQKPGGVTVPFRIVDNALKLTGEEWERVVAVFVQGPAWQFKGWPMEGNPVNLFTKMVAFHLKFEEHKLDTNVSKWNVNVLNLSKTKRHLERAELLRFWELLDKFLIKHKPHMRF